MGWQIKERQNDFYWPSSVVRVVKDDDIYSYRGTAPWHWKAFKISGEIMFLVYIFHSCNITGLSFHLTKV